MPPESPQRVGRESKASDDSQPNQNRPERMEAVEERQKQQSNAQKEHQDGSCQVFLESLGSPVSESA